MLIPPQIFRTPSRIQEASRKFHVLQILANNSVSGKGLGDGLEKLSEKEVRSEIKKLVILGAAVLDPLFPLKLEEIEIN